MDPSSNMPRSHTYKPTKSGAETHKGRENSLGISSNELNALYEQLDHDSGAAPSQRRQSARLSFQEHSIGLDIIQPGGGQTHLTVACRNISRTGLGFLHSAYMHVGTQVLVTLTHRTRGAVRIPASVARCRHVQRHIHEIGLKFAKPVNVRDYLQLDTLSQCFTSEIVDPTQLKGVVLIITEYRIEQACIQSMLSDTTMDFVTAANPDEGLVHAMKGVDIILCDHLFEKACGIDFIAKARKSGVRCPIIIMSADRSPDARTAIRNANADGFLAKPLEKDLLLRAVAEFLLVEGAQQDSATVLFSSLPSGSPMAALAEDFVSDLRKIGDELEQCAKAKDIDGIRRRCLRVAGPAPSLGFEPLAKMAMSLLTALDATMSIEESIVPLNTFIQTCKSVRKKAC